MKARTRQTAERDAVDRLRERRALKLMALGHVSPGMERQLARLARLPVAELRARAKAFRETGELKP
jgi:hypothetical protein